MKLSSIVSLAVALSAVTQAGAANNNWTNTAGGNWETASNWSLGTIPGASDLVQVGVNGAYTVTLGSSAINAFPTTLTNNGLNVYDFSLGSPGPTLNINYTNAATMAVNNSFIIGNGTVNLNTPNGGLSVAPYPYSTTMGYSPYGKFGTLNIQSGTFYGGGGISVLGNDVGSVSTMNIGTNGSATFGLVRLGNSGTAYVNINGGTFTPGHSFAGYVAGATGIVTMTSGRLFLGGNSSFGIGSGDYDSANHGYGQLLIYGGNFANGFEGFYSQLLIGSGVDAAGGGGVGDMQVYGGVHTNVAYVVAGSAINSKGTVLIGGGTWNMYDPWFVGANSNAYGRLTVTNGVMQDLFHYGHIHVASANYSRGELNLSGGEILLDYPFNQYDAWVEVGGGQNSTGTVHVTGGRLKIQNGGVGLLIGRNFDANFPVNNITNTTGVANVVLDGGRVELYQIQAAGVGVLSNRTGGVLQFLGFDSMSGTPSQFVLDGGTVSYKNYASVNVASKLSQFTIASGSGFELDSSTNANISGTYTLTNAANNIKTLRLTGAGPRWQSDTLAVSSGATLHVTNATNARVASVVNNSGTIQVDNSTVTYEKPVTISGRYVSDPSTNTFLTNVTVTASGTLEGGAGDLFDFKKSLFIQSTNNTGFNLRSSIVSFSGGGIHTNSISGLDRGTNAFLGDFAYGKLSLGSTSDNIFFTSGGGAEPTNALYVRELDLLGSTNNVAKLDAPANIHIYYLLAEHDPFNSYLMDKTYTLASGGLLLPVVPEPSALVLCIAVAAFFMHRKRRT